MTRILKSFVPAVLIVCVLSSCIVSKKKYDDLLSRKVKVESEKLATEEELKAAKAGNDKLTADLKKANEDLASSSKAFKDMEERFRKLEADNTSLDKNYQSSLSNTGKLSKDLARQQQDLLAAEQKLEYARIENEKLSTDLKAREARVSELEKVLAAKDSAVNLLKNKVSKALLNFKENDLTVNIKNGKVYVSLAEQLLFKSGSTSVDPKGVEALKQLANALKGQTDINVLVEGHTDDVRISKSSQYMTDNWDLSVMRATSITRILVNNGVAPTQITAAGKGEYFPLEAAKTADARQKNRRTEIILTPKLDELFQILESN